MKSVRLYAPPRASKLTAKRFCCSFDDDNNKHQKELKMVEAKGLSTPVKMKSELAALVGASALPRTEITKKIWDYIKANQLQTKTVNGKAENAGKYIVTDATLLPIFKNTKSVSKSGKATDLTGIKIGETVDMMQMAAIVGANVL
jgi:chromatin remodeling complex protein RSC6